MSTLAIKFLDFDEKRQFLQNKLTVKDKECKILRLVTRAYFQSNPLKVRMLIDMSSIASPATIHKSMKSLIAKGLIVTKEDKQDARIKYLVPTNRAIKLYSEIGKQM